MSCVLIGGSIPHIESILHHRSIENVLFYPSSFYYQKWLIASEIIFYMFFSKALIEDQLQETQGMCEYALYAQGLL